MKTLLSRVVTIRRVRAVGVTGLGLVLLWSCGMCNYLGILVSPRPLFYQRQLMNGPVWFEILPRVYDESGTWLFSDPERDFVAVIVTRDPGRKPSSLKSTSEAATFSTSDTESLTVEAKDGTIVVAIAGGGTCRLPLPAGAAEGWRYELMGRHGEHETATLILEFLLEKYSGREREELEDFLKKNGVLP